MLKPKLARELSPQDSIKDQAPADHKQEKAVYQFKFPSMMHLMFKNASGFISGAFLCCLRNRQKSRELLVSMAEPTSKEFTTSAKKRQQEGGETLAVKLSIPRSLTSYDLMQSIYEGASILQKQLGQKASLLLVLTSSQVVGAQCPNASYSCPDSIQPFPDASNGCNTTYFVEAFNATFKFSCDLIKNLTESGAQALFQQACQACMYPTTPTPVINDCIDALFYSNDTLCAIKPVNNLSNDEFNWKWLLMFLVLVPCGLWCTWEICKRKVDVKNLFALTNKSNELKDRQDGDEIRNFGLDGKGNYGAGGDGGGQPRVMNL